MEQKRRFVVNQVAAEPSVSKRSNSVDDMRVVKITVGLVVMRGVNSGGLEGVKITVGLVVMGTERLGPAPEMIPKQIRIVDSEIVGSKEIEPRLVLRWSPAAPVGSKEQIEATSSRSSLDQG